MQALADEIEDWQAKWEESRAIGRHQSQLALLAGVTGNLVTAFIASASQIDLAGDTVAVYEECRQADERILYVRRLWRWYADKLDQRRPEEDDKEAEADPVPLTLRAADEVIWSCWKTALKSLGVAPEFHRPSPLAYLSPQFAASATRRTDYPVGLRPVDKLVQEHVERLPIPVIAVPVMCQRRPWWLVVAAHEVGHHIQHDVPGLDAKRTQEALTAAVSPDYADYWCRWNEELFADVCAVLLTGPAAIWAITELETRPAPASDRVLDSRYPPSPVRLAVARTVAEKAGLRSSLSAERPVRSSADPPGDEEFEEFLGCVPAVADALLGLTSAGGRELRALAGATARAYDKGTIGDWQRDLAGKGRLDPEETLEAARFCLAGSVAAWQAAIAGDGDERELADRSEDLAERVRAVLPKCAEPGTRGPSEPDVAALAADLAGQFAADLLAADLLADEGDAGQP